MRIVHVLTRLVRGGSEENVLLTSAGQLARGHDVILLHGRDSSTHDAARLAPGAGLIAAPHLGRRVDLPRDAAALRELRRILEALAPDVVHTHQSKAGILGRFAAAAAGVPLIVHGVHILPFLAVGPGRRRAYLWAERAAARVTHGFVHVSEGMRRACLADGVGARRPHFVVPSGFDLDRFATAAPPPDSAALLRRQAGDGAPVTLVMLAALEPRKRHLELLHAARDLLRREPRLRLVLAGEGSLKPRIEAAIAALGLADRVTLAGYRDDPERIVAMADICIHCSEREGLPRSVLQYLVAGRPVVMFDLPGIEDVLADGRNGLVVPQGDWRGFTGRLEMLLHAPETRAALANGARRTDLRRWDARCMGDRTLAVYEELQCGARFMEATT